MDRRTLAEELCDIGLSGLFLDEFSRSGRYVAMNSIPIAGANLGQVSLEALVKYLSLVKGRAYLIASREAQALHISVPMRVKTRVWISNSNGRDELSLSGHCARASSLGLELNELLTE